MNIPTIIMGAIEGKRTGIGRAKWYANNQRINNAKSTLFNGAAGIASVQATNKPKSELVRVEYRDTARNGAEEAIELDLILDTGI